MQNSLEFLGADARQLSHHADFCSKHQQSTTTLITTLASRIVVLLSLPE
jgi:hypothetical protein